MKELRPLVDEYRELESVAERLGVKVDDSAPTRRRSTRSAPATRATGTRARKAPANGRRTRGRRSGSRRPIAARGQRQRELLELVKARPGITVREVGRELGVDPTSLYRIVRLLEQDGTIKKQGSELQPA
jgi:hypothetical protein